MKVYYEKLDGLKIMQDALALAEKYENSTGKKPNRISLTKEEFDALENTSRKSITGTIKKKIKHLV